MKLQSLKTAFFCCALLFCLSSNANAQSINLRALDAYWKITDRLRQGDSLSKADWKAFLAIDGNKQYVANQAFDEAFLEYYRKLMQVVYMPKNSAQLSKMMADKYKYWVAYKINQYQLNEKELKAYAAKLGGENYIDEMYKNSWEWLPKKLQTKSPNTKMFFIGIDNDALVQGDTIVFTLWSAFVQDQLKYGSLGGHELHHVLRKPHQLSGVTPQHEGILYTLNSIVNEGSADMIDKKFGLEHLDQVPPEYNFTDFLLLKPDSIIRQIDTVLQALSKPEPAKYATVKHFRKLLNYSSGHNPGYFMADVIVRNGLKKKLIKNVQNPFAFVYLYNEAAKKDAKHPPLFSDAAIANLVALEKQYWRF